SLRRFSVGRSVFSDSWPEPSVGPDESPRLCVGRSEDCSAEPLSSLPPALVDAGRRLSVVRPLRSSPGRRAGLIEIKCDLTLLNSEELISYSCLSGKRATRLPTSLMRSLVIG